MTCSKAEKHKSQSLFWEILRHSTCLDPLKAPAPKLDPLIKPKWPSGVLKGADRVCHLFICLFIYLFAFTGKACKHTEEGRPQGSP